MMKRIDLIELLVLVVFPQISVAPPPMLGSLGEALGLGSSRTPLYSLFHDVKSLSKGATSYGACRIHFRYYEDPTMYDYTIVTSTGEQILKNKGRNTNVVFVFDTKMLFHTKDNVNELYSLEFERPATATLFANRIISTNPSRYNTCTGSNAYKVEELYERSAAVTHTPLDETNNWCIFKDTNRQTNVTTFTIKWIGQIGQERGLKGIFRPGDFRLERVQGAGKFELTVSLGNKTLNPKYILETSTLEQLVAFMK